MPRRLRQGNGLPRPAFTKPLKANMTPGELERLEVEKEQERKRKEVAEKAERLERGEGTKSGCLQLFPSWSTTNYEEVGVVPDELVHFGA